MNSYLGVDISSLSYGKGFTFSQPFLIDQIIQALGFDPKTTKVPTDNNPAGYPLLNKDENGPARKASWTYRCIIGMLGYFQGTTRRNIAMANHQCAIFHNDTNLSHERRINHINRYIMDTRDKVMIYIPETSRVLECYVDADFAGRRKDGDHKSPESVLSRTGFVIMYA